ncbi:MAG: hypothetical protein Q8R01_12180 [Ramlibacter sp.]|nr:hypothetical protein [Ramlibacter sp.]
MIRFLPDTWRDALLRPIAMASPDANVYVEIAAPDIRFAAVVVLAVLTLIVRRRFGWPVSPLLILLAWVAAAFAVWLATTGNGRYFIPVLLAAGPLCIGFVCRLPGTRAFKGALALGLVAVQGLMLYENEPWKWWGLSTWAEPPFFDVALDQEALSVPATYVTITNISYSLVAPRFPAASRWVNISSLPSALDGSPDIKKMQAVLASSKSLKLLIPSRPKYMTEQLLPNEELRATINGMLRMQRLALAEPSDCRLLPSRGLASEALKDLSKFGPEVIGKFGFWICSLQYPVALQSLEVRLDPEVRDTFSAIEKRCPRFFQTGQTSASRLSDGWIRVYPQSDMKVYVMDNGEVHYKYWRAMNPVLVGRKQDVLRGDFTLDCDAIRGRAGLPWEREI